MSPGKNEEKQLSILKEIRKFGSGFLGIFRAIPLWLYVAIIPLLIGIGFTTLFFSINKGPNLDSLPQSQIVVDATTLRLYAYDGRTKGPAWVMQAITPGDATEKASKVEFYEDINIPPIMRSTLTDYKNSGFDIGNLLDVSAMGILNQPFPLSTTCPQPPKFNRIYWAKVNNYVKELIKKLEMRLVVVITGPLYLPHEEADGKKFVTYQVIGESNIAVPTHFFKAIFYPVEIPNNTDFSISSEIYVIPNQDLDESVPLASFRTSQENLEKISGIILPRDIKPFLKVFVPPPRI